MPGTTIEIQTVDGTADAYVAKPEGEGVCPGVLFFIDAIGLRPRIEEMADRIASWGYVVLAPNIFHRFGKAEDLAPRTDLKVPENRAAFMKDAMQRVHGLSSAEAMSDARSYLDALHALPTVSEKQIGTTGYCMGGRLSFLTACTFPDDVAAAGGFHSGGLVTDGEDSPHLLADQARAEMYFGHADEDRSMPAEAIDTFNSALDQAGLTFTSFAYEGAAHGYTMADIAAYDEEATEKHFAALADLFSRRLTI